MDKINQSNIEGLSIGAEIAGGYYTGLIIGEGKLFALVTAPKALEFKSAWGEYGTELEGARSYHDGAANTADMRSAGCAAAQANELADGWHIPSRDELELMYRAFKPTEEDNYGYRSGDNPSSVPPGYPYTEQAPAQTALDAFKAGGEQAFDDTWYWSSTQYSANLAWSQTFDVGYQLGYDKILEGRVRPVRRMLIQ